MNLYELTESYRMVQEMLDDEEVDVQAIFDTLEAIDGEFDVKADNIACLIKSETYGNDAIAAEIKKLQERKRIRENKTEKLRDYLLDMMQKMNRQKIETARNKISIRRNPVKVTVADIEVLRNNLSVWKARKWDENELDKTKIKERLSAGEVIDGVTLEASMSLTIR